MPFRPFFDTPEQRQERLARGFISSQARQNALRNAATELTIRRTTSPSGIPKLESMERTPGVDTAALARNRQTFEERQVVDKYIRDYAAGGPVQPFAYQSYPEYKAFVDRQLSNQVPSPTLTQGPLAGPPQPEVQPTAAEEQAINRAGFQPGQRGILTGGEAEQLTPQTASLTRPIIPRPVLSAVERVPYFGPPGRRALEQVNPLNVGAAALFPEGAIPAGLGALAGQTVLGGIGEAAGAPPPVQAGLEAAGAIGGGLAPFVAPAAAERIGSNLAIATERAGSPARLLAGERGGTRRLSGGGNSARYVVRASHPNYYGKSVSEVHEFDNLRDFTNFMAATRRKGFTYEGLSPDTAYLNEPAAERAGGRGALLAGEAGGTQPVPEVPAGAGREEELNVGSRLRMAIAELDAEGVPDNEYASLLSTGSRSLPKGQTWREKALNYADRLEEASARPSAAEPVTTVTAPPAEPPSGPPAPPKRPRKPRAPLPPEPPEPPLGGPPTKPPVPPEGGPPAGSPPPVAPFEYPPDEKIQRAVVRRYQGEQELQASELRQSADDIRRGARTSGVALSKNRTPVGERIISAMDSGDMSGLSTRERAVAENLSNILRQEQEAMVAADPAFEERLLDQYFPHFFKKATKPRPALGGGKPRFQKGRSLEGAIGEILDRRSDLDLVSWDPTDIVTMRVAEGIRYRAGLRMRQRLEAGGFAKPISEAPDDWVVPDSPIFRGEQFRPIRSTSAKPAGELAERARARAERLSAKAERLEELPADELVGGRTVKEPVATPPDVAEFLNDTLGSSLFGKNRVLRGWRGFVAAGKFAKTFGGLFQSFDYTTRQLALGTAEAGSTKFASAARGAGVTGRAIGRAFSPAIDRNMTRFDLADPVRRALIENGLSLQGGRDIIEREMRDLVSEPGFLVRRGVTDNAAARRIKGVLGYLTDATFLKQHREHVLSYGEQLTKKFMQDGDSLDIAAAKAAAEVNEKFSSLPNWQSVFRDPTFRDVTRSMFFSPNETEAWFRNFFRAFDVRKPGSALRAARFWVGMGINTAVLANFIHFVSTGKPLPVDRYNPVSGEKGDLGLPFSYNTEFLRPDIPFKGPLGQVLQLDILGQADTPFRFALAPIYGTKSRLSQPAQLATALAPLLSGQEVRNFQGKPIKGPQAAAEFAAGQVIPIPLQGFLEESGRIGTPGAAIQVGGLNISAEPLPNTLARRFQEVKGRPFNPEVDYAEAEQTPELQPILNEMRARGLEFATAGSVQRQAIEQTRTNLETQRGLPDLAARFSAGETRLGPELMQRYRDYKSELGGAFELSDVLRGKDREPQSQAGKDLQAWREINPYSSKYQDPQTGQVDWDAYDTDKNAALAKIPEYAQTAIKERLHTQTPQLQGVERQLEGALDLRDQLFDIPAHKGTTKEDESNLRRVEAQVDRHLDELARQGIDTAKLSDHVRQGVYILAAKDVGLDRTFGVAAYVLRPGSKMDEKLRNLDYDQFLIDHESELRPFFPNLYSRKVLREAALIGQ